MTLLHTLFEGKTRLSIELLIIEIFFIRGVFELFTQNPSFHAGEITKNVVCVCVYVCVSDFIFVEISKNGYLKNGVIVIFQLSPALKKALVNV